MHLTNSPAGQEKAAGRAARAAKAMFPRSAGLEAI